MSGFTVCINEQENYKLTKNNLEMMNNLIKHRDPEHEGYYDDDIVQIAFRNSKNKDGNAPITFENEQFVIVYNGKIYNCDKLRSNLQEEGTVFNTTSEAEVILALYSKIKEQTASKLQGMFSFIIWDKSAEQLYGARDHFGIKPLFYYENKDRTIFASEKKTIVATFEEETVNNTALQHYLTYQFVPEPETMTNDIKKIEPGHYFIKKPQEKTKVEQYWKVSFQPVVKSEDEYVKAVRNVMISAVDSHLQGDEEIGSFLSGGIDSSFIAALAKQVNPQIKTFSVGFEREGFSEVDVAKETADKLNVENISYIISPEEYMKELPKIIWHLDDPLADPACVPLYFVAREAKRHVNIALSGEGADELFGGYNIYREPQSLAMFDKIPTILKALLKQIAKIMPEGMKGKSFIERGCTPLEQRYIGNAKMFIESEKRQFLTSYNKNLPYTNITNDLYEECKNYGQVEKMQYIDMHTWMRGDILLKADKMTMAHALEVRNPFLDLDVFNIAREIPTNLKIADGTTKYVLRKAAEGIVPDHVLYRKKLGFPVPIRHWLKDEMHDWTKKMINESNIDHFIDKTYVLNLLDRHCQNKGDYSRKIWTVLVFCIWHKVYVEQEYSFAEQVQQAYEN